MKNLKFPIKNLKIEKSSVQIRRITYAGKLSCCKCDKRSIFIREIVIFKIKRIWLCPACYYQYITTLIKQ